MSYLKNRLGRGLGGLLAGSKPSHIQTTSSAKKNEKSQAKEKGQGKNGKKPVALVASKSKPFKSSSSKSQPVSKSTPQVYIKKAQSQRPAVKSEQKPFQHSQGIRGSKVILTKAQDKSHEEHWLSKEALEGKGHEVTTFETANVLENPQANASFLSSPASLGQEIQSTDSSLNAAFIQSTSLPVPLQSQSLGLKDFQEVVIERVDANPYQPRRSFDENHLQELADSIRSEGLLQPIVVRPVGDRYQLIAGERRLRACQLLRLKKIPAKVLQVGDSSSAVIALIENLQREGLNPVEESLGYASLMRDFGLTQEAVAERVGKGRATIANALRLLQLDREIQGYLSKNMVSTGHAKVLLGVEDEAQRLILARRIVENNLSVRETEQLVRQAKAIDQASKAMSRGTSLSSADQTVVRDLEKQIASKLNTKVQIKHTPKKGKIIIEYFGNEDLQRILERTNLD